MQYNRARHTVFSILYGYKWKITRFFWHVLRLWYSKYWQWICGILHVPPLPEWRAQLDVSGFLYWKRLTFQTAYWFFGVSAFWAVITLPMALLKIWLFPNSHLLITANESRRNSFQKCWLPHPIMMGILQITQHWTAADNSSQSTISLFSIPLLVTSGRPDLLTTLNAVLKALLKLRCVTTAAPLVSTNTAGFSTTHFWQINK